MTALDALTSAIRNGMVAGAAAERTVTIPSLARGPVVGGRGTW